MATVSFSPSPRTMAGGLGHPDVFPGEHFGINIPEAIGDATRTVWQNLIRTEWTRTAVGAWQSRATVAGELAYAAELTCGADTVDIRISLTNESDRVWSQSLAFNCLNCGSAPSVRDHECIRHWVGSGGHLRQLATVPRVFGPRPTIQLYSVQGSPPGADIPFVARFAATPSDVALEGWMAIEARDKKRLVAVVSRPALFLFQNMEYSCIHSSPGFGPLAPGETGEALTRIYFARASVPEWYERMKNDMA